MTGQQRPTITQLEYLVAAARTLNFREAAEQMHATQPAVSAQIQKLERILGATLFERDRRKVLLTDAGARAAEDARRVLTAMDDLMAATDAEGAPMTGQLRLGIIPTVAPFVLPRLFANLRNEHPDLHVQIHEGQTAHLVRKLREGALDLLLLAIDVDLGEGALETRALFEDPFVLAVPTHHPFTERGRIAAEDLTVETVLLLDDGHCLAEQTRAYCNAAAGHASFAEFRAASLTTLLQMVAANLGTTLVPELALASLGESSGVRFARIQDPEPQRTIGLVWRPGSPRTETFDALGALVADRSS